MNDLIEITLGNLIKDLGERYPDRLAVKYTDRDFERTWKQLDEEVERLAQAFMAIGIKKGDHVAIWATNTPNGCSRCLPLQRSCGTGNRKHQLQGV
jgi:fatty-acyl-CoA synthase